MYEIKASEQKEHKIDEDTVLFIQRVRCYIIYPLRLTQSDFVY